MIILKILGIILLVLLAICLLLFLIWGVFILFIAYFCKDLDLDIDEDIPEGLIRDHSLTKPETKDGI